MQFLCKKSVKSEIEIPIKNLKSHALLMPARLLRKALAGRRQTKKAPPCGNGSAFCLLSPLDGEGQERRLILLRKRRWL